MLNKDEIKRIIDNLPDNSSLEDLQYSLYVKSKIQKGLQDIKTGNMISDKEMEKRFEKWFMK